MNNKVSVVTVTYNAAATLEKTILSVVNQSYRNLEYIIIDGGSKDSTLSIIKKYKYNLGYWISEKDEGIYDAMNKGVKASTGDWVIFLGGDDAFYNENVVSEIFAPQQHSAFEPPDFIYGDVILKSRSEIFGGSRTYEELINKNINHQSIFYNRSIFKKSGLFNLKYKILSDYDFNLKIFRDSSLNTLYISKVITLYNDKGLSNQVIDGNFYEDQLNYFLEVDKLSVNDPRLQKYFFFYGFAQFLKNEKIAGLKNILYSLTFGKRKLYYFLVSVKYFLSLVGVFKRMRTSFLPGSSSNIVSDLISK
jgi:glycosyltransferase involved in cell wall biosynthesis